MKEKSSPHYSTTSRDKVFLANSPQISEERNFPIKKKNKSRSPSPNVEYYIPKLNRGYSDRNAEKVPQGSTCVICFNKAIYLSLETQKIYCSNCALKRLASVSRLINKQPKQNIIINKLKTIKSTEKQQRLQQLENYLKQLQNQQKNQNIYLDNISKIQKQFQKYYNDKKQQLNKYYQNIKKIIDKSLQEDLVILKQKKYQYQNICIKYIQQINQNIKQLICQQADIKPNLQIITQAINQDVYRNLLNKHKTVMNKIKQNGIKYTIKDNYQILLLFKPQLYQSKLYSAISQFPYLEKLALKKQLLFSFSNKS